MTQGRGGSIDAKALCWSRSSARGELVQKEGFPRVPWVRVAQSALGRRPKAIAAGVYYVTLGSPVFTPLTAL